MNDKKKIIIVAFIVVLYIIFLFFVTRFEVKTYDTMNVDERIWTELQASPW